MYEIVTRISEGKGKPDDLELLEELAQTCKDASMCGLGQTAATPSCPPCATSRRSSRPTSRRSAARAGVCKSLTASSSLPDNVARGCLACKKACPNDCIHAPCARFI